MSTTAELQAAAVGAHLGIEAEITGGMGPNGFAGFKLIEAGTGRPLHDLEIAGATLADDVARLRDEVSQIQTDRDHSKEWKDARIGERRAKIAQYLEAGQADFYQRALSEFEAINGEYQAQRAAAVDSFRARMAGMLPAAEAELNGKYFGNLGELDAFYQWALKNDPTMAYLIELQGEKMARQLDPNNPGNGSWAKTLERGRAGRGETDATRALAIRLKSLKAGVQALSKVSANFHRQTAGVDLRVGPAHARNFEQLSWAISSTLAENAQPQPGTDLGLSGGVYMPSALPIFEGGVK